MSQFSVPALLADLDLDTKVSLLSGADFWRTREVAAFGIPALKLSDGPNGIRGDLNRCVASACFPVGVALGASWNPALIAEIGQALAQEARCKNVSVVLGPTINLQRLPVGGRHFECMSEDPLLTGHLAAAFINGVQLQGVGACPKHFVGNETELDRYNISVEIDPATLRQAYLLPFEISVMDARPWMIMSAYNRVGGVYASSHAYLLKQVLKREWGFDGVVVSDWGAAVETEANALGGLDLEMPGPGKVWRKKLVAAVEAGVVPMAEIDDKVGRLLHLINRSGAKVGQAHAPEQALDDPNHRALARRAAAESFVLLKNNGNVLPLNPGFSGCLAVIGPNAAFGQIMGGGSSHVLSHPPIHPLAGLRAAFPAADIRYAQGCRNNKYAPILTAQDVLSLQDGRGGFTRSTFADASFTGSPTRVDRVETSLLTLLETFSGAEKQGSQDRVPGGVRLEGIYRAHVTGPHSFGMMSAGRARLYLDDVLVVDNWENWQRGESFYAFGSNEVRMDWQLIAGQDYHLRVDYERPVQALVAGVQFGIEPPLVADSIAEAATLALESDAVILVLGSNPDWETEGHDRTRFELPGEQDTLARAVLTANPNTCVVLNVGAATALPWYDQAKAALVCWFGGQELGNALGDVLSGTVDPSGRLPFSWPRTLASHPGMAHYPGEAGRLIYREGQYFGYRGYDLGPEPPLAAFGHGLSYGAPAVLTAELAGTVAQRRIRVRVGNLAHRPARAVVQVYAGTDPELATRDAHEPVRVLAGFAKRDIPASSETEVEVQLDARMFRRWDEVAGCFQPDLRPKRLWVGLSSAGPFVEIPSNASARNHP